MTPDAQRIAIAVACGWSNCSADNYGATGKPPAGFKGDITNPFDGNDRAWIPDYLCDLNAMHEAEKVLTDKQWSDYINWHLRCAVADSRDRGVKMCGSPLSYELPWLVGATAKERAEAFLHAADKHAEVSP